MENEAYSKIVKLCGMEVAEVREQLSDLLIAQDKVQFDINGAFGEVVIRLYPRMKMQGKRSKV